MMHTPAPWDHETHPTTTRAEHTKRRVWLLEAHDYDHACDCVNALAGRNPSAVTGLVRRADGWVITDKPGKALQSLFRVAATYWEHDDGHRIVNYPPEVVTGTDWRQIGYFPLPAPPKTEDQP